MKPSKPEVEVEGVLEGRSSRSISKRLSLAQGRLEKRKDTNNRGLHRCEAQPSCALASGNVNNLCRQALTQGLRRYVQGKQRAVKCYRFRNFLLLEVVTIRERK